MAASVTGDAGGAVLASVAEDAGCAVLASATPGDWRSDGRIAAAPPPPAQLSPVPNTDARMSRL